MNRVHSASCGGSGALWPFASGRPTTAAGLEIITRVIRAAQGTSKTWTDFPRSASSAGHWPFWGRLPHQGRYAICVQDVLGPCVNIKISHCALCQDSGLKIWLAENEESRKEALTVAGGSHFLMLLLMWMICMQRTDNEDEDGKDGW